MGSMVRKANTNASTENWHLLLQVFSCLDGPSLGRATCACKAWREVGVQEDLWQQICRAKWPSLDSNAGSCVVKQAGGYRRLFARRFQAQHAQHRSDEEKPCLSLQSLIFLVDVTVGNEVLCSFVRRGHELSGGEVFQFTVSLCDGEVVGKGREVEKIEALRNVKVSWAVMVMGSDRVFQVMDSIKAGQVIGGGCSFWEALADHRCCCAPGMSQHLAEVGLGLGVNGGLQEVSLALLNTLDWRYFSIAHALTYFQHLFFG
ncbi:hypothetical protein SUGI_1148510 [Cryptomeria japonica]|uniref:uncharacterized protein LOC131051700 n=1 Tax=Cryptomeria japonica TaxID=3369 RepID=UPI002414888D|nr:uncharacterized protein LOC131051700 [Cryptomeria japonica]GLJ53807.1 hypothetical protein SUGI_1148510 [Cryptomeria japonica]